MVRWEIGSCNWKAMCRSEFQVWLNPSRKISSPLLGTVFWSAGFILKRAPHVAEKMRNWTVPAYISYTKESQQKLLLIQRFQEKAWVCHWSGLSQVCIYNQSLQPGDGMLWCARLWFCLTLSSPRSRWWAKNFSENSLLEVARNVGVWQGSQPIQGCYITYQSEIRA